MLARLAAEFYWLGRHAERIEHTARLLRFQLNRLPDRPVDELTLGWQAVYRILGQPSVSSHVDGDDAETVVIPDAYTLAGKLVEERANPDSLLSCWEHARENGQRVRAELPLPVWTCLNQGFLWIRDSDFTTAWTRGPSALVGEAVDRLHLLAGVVEAVMPRDEAWRFLELGRFIERLQHQAELLAGWVEFNREEAGASALSWADLLRVCSAYEVYCRRHSTNIERQQALGLLTQDPEVPRSLRFAAERIARLLAGIDPVGARYPMAAPHRMALRLAASIEVEPTGLSGEAGEFFRSVAQDGRVLHDLTMAAYVTHSLPQELAT
ncbi:MAG: alpha-E domain-containing protein [Deltaproteobacteria bacterium]|nr:alpha-E domain-containing protein [Deltaproteobacteria bacterium]